jgi:hypothetical protein
MNDLSELSKVRFLIASNFKVNSPDFEPLRLLTVDAKIITLKNKKQVKLSLVETLENIKDIEGLIGRHMRIEVTRFDGDNTLDQVNSVMECVQIESVLDYSKEHIATAVLTFEVEV